MSSDYGFENRKAFIERSRDEKLLKNMQQNNNNPSFPKSLVASDMNRYRKQARFDNNVHMGGMHKDGFNRNFNKDF